MISKFHNALIQYTHKHCFTEHTIYRNAILIQENSLLLVTELYTVTYAIY